MVTRVNDDLADAMLALLVNSDDDVEVTLHTDDPEEDHTAHLTTAVGPVVVALAEWTALAAHGPSNGRKTDNDAAIEFGNASTEEELTHFGVRHLDTGYFASAALVTPQTTSTGNPVLFPAGNLLIFAAGQS